MQCSEIYAITNICMGHYKNIKKQQRRKAPNTTQEEDKKDLKKSLEETMSLLKFE